MERKFIIGVIISLLLTGVAYAGDTLSLSISCTIPAIPGVNAPLIEEETLTTKEDPNIKEKIESQEAIQPQSPAMIQQDNQEEKLMYGGQNSLVLVKTIYSR